MLCGVRLDTWLYAISVAWTAIVFATLIYIVRVRERGTEALRPNADPKVEFLS